MAQRCLVYIDGFNLYYGSVRGTPHRWLDIQGLFERLRPHDDVIRIKYFTALIDGAGRERQQAYLRALATLPKVEVIEGRFKRKRESSWWAMRSFSSRACSFPRVSGSLFVAAG